MGLFCLKSVLKREILFQWFYPTQSQIPHLQDSSYQFSFFFPWLNEFMGHVLWLFEIDKNEMSQIMLKE